MPGFPLSVCRRSSCSITIMMKLPTSSTSGDGTPAKVSAARFPKSKARMATEQNVLESIGSAKHGAVATNAATPAARNVQLHDALNQKARRRLSQQHSWSLVLHPERTHVAQRLRRAGRVLWVQGWCSLALRFETLVGETIAVQARCHRRLKEARSASDNFLPAAISATSRALLAGFQLTLATYFFLKGNRLSSLCPREPQLVAPVTPLGPDCLFSQ